MAYRATVYIDVGSISQRETNCVVRSTDNVMLRTADTLAVGLKSSLHFTLQTANVG